MSDNLATQAERLGRSLSLPSSSKPADVARFIESACEAANAITMGSADLAEFVAAMGAMSSTFDLGYSFSGLDLHLYSRNGVRIELLNWINSTTNIHTHSFCGAFKVLNGVTIHSQFAFVADRDLGPSLRIGRIALLSTEVLRAGDVRKITEGDDFVHANMHVSLPTQTVVVRTINSTAATQQWEFLSPCFARDQSADNRQSRFLRRWFSLALKSMSVSQAVAALIRQLEACDQITIFNVAFSPEVRRLADNERAAILNTSAELLDVGSGCIMAASDEEKRKLEVLRRKAKIDTFDERFILASLFENDSPERAHIMLEDYKKRYV